MNVQTTLRPAASNAVLAAACIILSVVAPLVAVADPTAERTGSTRESHVSLSDLDLATPEGVARAHKRLQRRAEYLCRQLWDDDSMLRRPYEACISRTLANAVQQLNTSVLAAADGARTK